MSDRDIERRLRSETAGERAPSESRLRSALASELERADGRVRIRPAIRARSTPSLVGFATAIALILAIVLVQRLIVDGRPAATPPAAANLLDHVRSTGVLRVAVSPVHPQVQGPVGIDGFDVDLAEVLAEAMALESQIVVVARDELRASRTTRAWDVALPSVDATTLGSGWLTSDPYYFWSRFLLVQRSAGLQTVADLEGEQVCAVEGDPGASWLVDGLGGTAVSLVTRATDEDCLAALDSGVVSAIVTSELSLADLGVRPSLQTIGGPPAEARAVATLTASGPARLVAEVNEALARLRADGTLTRLSQNRFGGHDLTVRPAGQETTP